MIRYVDSPQALAALCAELAGSPWLALDTEFLREDTYYPKLCLLQIATPGLTACVDPLALTKLDPLLERIFDPAITKLFHACHQDMEIFYHLSGRLPQPVFDTQIAAPLVGLPYQASYAALVKDTLDVTLAKGHARTDWRRRPLSAEQLAYAADDVRYLGPMYTVLRQRLIDRGRLDWPAEEFTAVCDVERYRNPPEDAWKRIRGIGRMPRSSVAIARALAEWRETVARREDRPRGWIVRDDAVLDLARLAPTDFERLSQVKTLRRQTVARYGEALLAVIREAAAVADDASIEPSRTGPLTAAQEEVIAAMAALIRTRADEQAIHPSAIASRADLVDLLRGRRDSILLRGWRRDVVGQELLDIRDKPRTPVSSTPPL